ncbi:hypothetical protein D9M69_580880 [compost metagenome]
MYWPAWYWKVSDAGNCRCMTITSCEARSSRFTRTGIFLIGKAPASVTWRDSSTTSDCATPQQVSA